MSASAPPGCAPSLHVERRQRISLLQITVPRGFYQSAIDPGANGAHEAPRAPARVLSFPLRRRDELENFGSAQHGKRVESAAANSIAVGCQQRGLAEEHDREFQMM